MIERAEVIKRMRHGEMMQIAAAYNNVALYGAAFCDAVTGGGGRDKLRAKFNNGIKAVLDLDDYGSGWKAEEIQAPPPEATAKTQEAAEAGEALRAEDLPQEAENMPQEATEAAGEAAEAVPWYGDTPAEQEKQRQELEALRRESKRLYDAERYRRRKEAETPGEAAAARRAKSAYDAERYRKRKAAAAPPPPERA